MSGVTDQYAPQICDGGFVFPYRACSLDVLEKYRTTRQFVLGTQKIAVRGCAHLWISGRRVPCMLLSLFDVLFEVLCAGFGNRLLSTSSQGPEEQSAVTALMNFIRPNNILGFCVDEHDARFESSR